MKVAFLTTDNRDAHRRYDLAEPYFGTAPEALLQGFAHLPEIEVHVVSCLQQPVRSPEKLAPNIYFHPLHVPKIGWLRTGYQGCIRATRNFLQKLRPDIVHGQGTERDCSISAIFSGFPNVMTIHGNIRLVAKVNKAKPFTFWWLAARLEGFTLKRTDGVVCISTYTQNAVKDLAPRTWVHPNAVDEGFFPITATPDPAHPIGLCVGTICLRKNQNAFIRALDPLAAERKFKILFFGEVDKSDYGAEFHRLVDERPWCEYLGWAGREEMRKHFRTATFNVLPTLEDNCPMVVLEGMASGVPCIASKVGGVPDLIDPGKTGLFCDPARPETFRETVARLLDDPDFARQLAQRAKEEALKRFEPSAVARRHVEIYREVLDIKAKS